MDGEQLGRQFARFRLARLADGDARIHPGELMVQPRRDLDDLPPVRADEARIGRQQALQQRGPAAHHPDDDDRRGHPLVENLRMAADPLLGAKPHPQAVHDARAQDVGTDRVEVGARIVAQQDGQRLFEFARAPVGEPFLALRVGQDGGRLEDAGGWHEAQNFRWWLTSPTWSTNMVRLSKHQAPSTR